MVCRQKNQIKQQQIPKENKNNKNAYNQNQRSDKKNYEIRNNNSDVEYEENNFYENEEKGKLEKKNDELQKQLKEHKNKLVNTKKDTQRLINAEKEKSFKDKNIDKKQFSFFIIIICFLFFLC